MGWNHQLGLLHFEQGFKGLTIYSRCNPFQMVVFCVTFFWISERLMNNCLGFFITCWPELFWALAASFFRVAGSFELLRLFGKLQANLNMEFTRWWFQIYFIFIFTWGNDPIWLKFFKLGGNHQPDHIAFCMIRIKIIGKNTINHGIYFCTLPYYPSQVGYSQLILTYVLGSKLPLFPYNRGWSSTE